MSTTGTKVPRVIQVAQQIETDIRKRRLKPGSSYDTTLETARKLRVSAGIANKALQLLVNRGLLHRRPRLGTIIANPPTDALSPPLERVHLLVHQNYLKSEGLLADGVIVGMQHALPGVDVAFNFMPPIDDADQVERLLAEAMRSDQKHGFVLVRSSLAAQRLVHQSGMPVVIFGSLHPSLPPLAQVDRDHAEGGRLLADHLLRRGGRRLLVLMRERLLPGDHLFLDGIRQALAEHHRGADDLVFRGLPNDPPAIAAETARVIGNGKGWAVLCRSEPLAKGAATAIDSDAAAAEVPLAACDVYRRGNENPPPFAHIRPAASPIEQGEHLGRMLAQQAEGRPADPLHHTVAVELIPAQDATANPRSE